ncbi:hypothetical protein CPLU01_01536 [Colletotrichum plurivorum]|uniref:Uncharacterized protein n=1 Tax=Colletotrichum plurivorum TaxID=2175906 RepID=A0A8H6U0Y0_9PEZI|nr:hypothetical protein CPLU01_01536 [Colletotrichum plurivorum]
MPLPASKHVLGESIKLRVTKFRVRHGQSARQSTSKLQGVTEEERKRGRGRLTPYAVTHWHCCRRRKPLLVVVDMTPPRANLGGASAAARQSSSGFPARKQRPPPPPRRVYSSMRSIASTIVRRPACTAAAVGCPAASTLKRTQARQCRAPTTELSVPPTSIDTSVMPAGSVSNVPYSYRGERDLCLLGLVGALAGIRHLYWDASCNYSDGSTSLGTNCCPPLRCEASVCPKTLTSASDQPARFNPEPIRGPPPAVTPSLAFLETRSSLPFVSFSLASLSLTQKKQPPRPVLYPGAARFPPPSGKGSNSGQFTVSQSPAPPFASVGLVWCLPESSFPRVLSTVYHGSNPWRPVRINQSNQNLELASSPPPAPQQASKLDPLDFGRLSLNR